MEIITLARAEVLELLTYHQAVDAVSDALHAGVDPATDLPRSSFDLADGQFLLMPSDGAAYSGVKALSVSRENARRGLPTIQGHYLLFERPTLTPIAVIEGSALTQLRTPAVSLSVVRRALPRRDLNVVVYGHGIQARAHAECLIDACPSESSVASVTFLVRDPDRGRDLKSSTGAMLAVDDPEATRRLASADMIICATSARTPIFDSDLVSDSAIVVAVGSHEPDAREVDGKIAARATVVVEDVATALRESGDVIQAIDEGFLTADRLVPMKTFVTGAKPAIRGPLLFKSSGMSWEDLAVASAVYRNYTASQSPQPTAGRSGAEAQAEGKVR